MEGALMWLLPLAFAFAFASTAQAADDVRIDDVHVYPESLSADRAGRLYIGSVKGVVFRTAPKGDLAEPWIRPDAENGILSILGVLTDEPHHTLWLCSAPMPFRTPPAVGTSALLAFDLATGRIKARYEFPAPASACNDVTIARDGSAYATDTPNGRIFVLTPGAKALALYAEDPKLKGVDGIAFGGDGRLYVNNVQANTMLRIDRKPDGSFAGLTPLALSQPVKGPDGLRLLDGNRFLQAEGGSGKVTLVRIDGDKATITDLRTGLDSSPGVTAARGRAYAVEGKIQYLVVPALKGKEPGPFAARAIALPARK
jgi:sugar lactone lactonase YvrE